MNKESWKSDRNECEYSTTNGRSKRKGRKAGAMVVINNK